MKSKQRRPEPKAANSKNRAGRSPIEILRADNLAQLSAGPARAKTLLAGDDPASTPARTKAVSASWLVHGFSTRQGGVSPEYGGRALNLARTREDTPENIEQNRRLFLRALIPPVQQKQTSRLPAIPALRKTNPSSAACRPWPLVTVRQIHSAVIHHVKQPPAQPQQGDGLITQTPGILLAIQTADCLPVLLADPDHRAVGIFHAGWRGTLARIVEKGVGEMREHFGSEPERLQAAIGPGIGVCCYEIGEEVEREFESQFSYAAELFESVFESRSLPARYPMLFMNQRPPGHGDPAMKRHLNLVKANLLQLRDAGVAEKNIFSLGLCTSCRTDLFFSYRKEHVTGRMLAVIGIRP